jgi:hypothetical protein
MEGRDNRRCALTKFRIIIDYGKERGEVNNDLQPRPRQCEPYMTRNPGTVTIDEEDDECT